MLFRSRVTYDGQTTSRQCDFYMVANRLLYDDFGDPGTGWATGDRTNYSLNYVDGEYQMLVKSPYRVVRSTAPGLNLGDAVLEVEARNAGSVVGAYGLLLAISADNQSFYMLAVSSDGFYKVTLLASGAWETLIDWTESPFVSRAEAINHLMTVRRGDEISLYANGAYLATVMDSTLGSGGVGLVAQAFEEGGVDLRFDSFRAYQPEGFATSAEPGPQGGSDRDADVQAPDLGPGR